MPGGGGEGVWGGGGLQQSHGQHSHARCFMLAAVTIHTHQSLLMMF